MPIKSTKKYSVTPRDIQKNFNGKQLTYVSWDHHLLFSAPFILCLSPETQFSELVDEGILPTLQADPDLDKINWHEVTWLKANKPWVPDFSKSLADNGLVHKDQIRFHTPNLNTLCGTK
ncbi:MAG: phenol hydroxylase [Colwellia sp.]|nr:MAG: phenol hydroxylase [Colwellia sp.]